MLFPLLIPIAFGAVSAITAVVGVKKGYDGCADISKAREIVGKAHRRGRSAMADAERMRLTVNRQADAYGDLLLTVQRETFGRFAAFVERIGQKSSIEEDRASKTKARFLTVQSIVSYTSSFQSFRHSNIGICFEFRFSCFEFIIAPHGLVFGFFLATDGKGRRKGRRRG